MRRFFILKWNIFGLNPKNEIRLEIVHKRFEGLFGIFDENTVFAHLIPKLNEINHRGPKHPL